MRVDHIMFTVSCQGGLCVKCPQGRSVVLVLDEVRLKRLLMFDADEDGLLPILLAAAEAEDAGNLEDLRGEERP